MTAAPIIDTPYDGDHVQEYAGSLYTSIWSTNDHIYVAAPVTISTVEQSRVAKLTKAGVEVADVQLAARSHDNDPGHRGASVAVTSDGTVVTHAARHQQAWDGDYSTTPGDLSTLTSVTTPFEADIRCSYVHFMRNPHNGDLYCSYRGNRTGGTGQTVEQVGVVAKWNASTDEWDKIAEIEGVTRTSYTAQLAFTSTGTIYATVSTHDFGPGFPWSTAGVVKTTDGGTTWTDLDGNACSNPIRYDEGTAAFPTGDAETVFGTELIVTDSDELIAVGQWNSDDDDNRSLWMAKWNGSSFDRTRLAQHFNNVAYSGASYQGGRLFILYNGHRTDHNSAYHGGPLHLLVSDDDGATFDGYTLDNGPVFGCHIDQRSYELDGVLRFIPMFSDVTRHEIWSVTVPAVS